MISDRVLPSTAVLISGGLDSSILVSFLLRKGYPVQPLYIRSGLRWEPAELAATKRILADLAAPRLAPLVILELPVGDLYEGHWSITGRGVPDGSSPDEAVYLHGRNALLTVKAALWCQLHGIGEIALGVLGSNPFADASPEFFGHLQAALNCTRLAGVRIRRPFAQLSKPEVMRLGGGLPLELTFSCIDPQDGLHCGRCNKCAERRRAFQSAEMEDLTQYATPIPRAENTS